MFQVRARLGGWKLNNNLGREREISRGQDVDPGQYRPGEAECLFRREGQNYTETDGWVYPCA